MNTELINRKLKKYLDSHTPEQLAEHLREIGVEVVDITDPPIGVSKSAEDVLEEVCSPFKFEDGVYKNLILKAMESYAAQPIDWEALYDGMQDEDTSDKQDNYISGVRATFDYLKRTLK